MKTTTTDIAKAKLDYDQEKTKFLRERGWRHTSELACICLWHKEIETNLGKKVMVAVAESTAIMIERIHCPDDDEDDEAESG